MCDEISLFESFINFTKFVEKTPEITFRNFSWTVKIASYFIQHAKCSVTLTNLRKLHTSAGWAPRPENETKIYLVWIVFLFVNLFIRICYCSIMTRVVMVITALHVMQTRYCDENSVRPSVCPSVRPSVCHTRVLWQNGRKICPDLYTIRKYI